jgi:hypothetical protein
MAKIKGGVRMTNEGDDFARNFCITRMAASATRFYGAKLGYEPAGFGTARGVMARLFNTITTGAEHLFYYYNNLYSNDQAIDMWLRYAPLLDRRLAPMMDVAVFYPDTANKLSDDVIRWPAASAFYQRVEALRAETDFDYVSEPMIEDGALDRYKVLVFLWGDVTEKPVIERIDRWLRAGGTVIYPSLRQARGAAPLSTIEGDASLSRRWQQGDTGQGRVLFFDGHPQPLTEYCRFVRNELRAMANVRPQIRRALSMEKPPNVYWSVLSNGQLVLLNFGDNQAAVRLERGKTLRLAPYSIVME